MSQNFIACDRGQGFLLPPSMSDWLAEGHLVWTVLGAVDQMSLDGFYGAYRANGQGRAAYDPRMMVALLLYSYCVGVRSSRQVERACRGDVAFRVIAAMEVPDHSTIAEFRRRHQDAVAELFVEVLSLCAEAGLVKVGEIAVDGTKMHASACYDRNRGYASIVEEILEQAEQVDREEDERFGEARGDELPEQLRTREGRRAALAAARERLQAEREARQAAGEQVVDRVELDLVVERFVTRPEGRKAWLREGRRVLDAQREQRARPVARGREERITEVKRRLDEELAFTHAANRCYEQHRATGRMSNGRRFGAPPHPYVPPLVPEGKINTTDPDSAVMIQQGQPPMQGYNAQAAVTTNQIIVAAEVTRTRRTSGSWNRSSAPLCATCKQLGSARHPRRCSRMPATGTPNRCNGSSLTECRYSSHPTADCVKAHARAGKAGITRSCAASSPPSSAARSIASASTASSRCSARSKATAGSTASDEEAGPPCGRNGD